MSIARTIISARAALGWTQAELASRASIEIDVVDQIERAEVLADTSTLSKLERALAQGFKSDKR